MTSFTENELMKYLKECVEFLCLGGPVASANPDRFIPECFKPDSPFIVDYAHYNHNTRVLAVRFAPRPSETPQNQCGSTHANSESGDSDPANV